MLEVKFGPVPSPERWDRLVEESNEGTVYHRLNFLRYHGDRFAGRECHLSWWKSQELVGVMPVALIEDSGKTAARSPYGGSYGGPALSKPLTYAESHEVVAGLIEYLQEVNADSCTLTLPLPCCHREYSDTFKLALMEAGFVCSARDVSSVVPLSEHEPPTRLMRSRAKTGVSKATKAGVEAVHDASLSDFWTVVEKTHAKLGIRPTHTLQEYEWLSTEIPGRVYADVAYLAGRPIAGIGVVVVNDLVTSSFYLCHDPDYQHHQALSLLILRALERATENGSKWFDFGTSSADGRGRANLFRFKEGFGAIGQFRETYAWTMPDGGGS